MKKLFLPLIVVVLLFSSCRDKAHILTYYYEVAPSEWTAYFPNNDTTAAAEYYYSTWRNIDITPDVIANGVTLVYYIDDFDRDNLLPYTTYFLDNNGIPHQERMEYDIEFNRDYGCGLITFKIKATDFIKPELLEDTKTKYFKVSVISNY